MAIYRMLGMANIIYQIARYLDQHLSVCDEPGSNSNNNCSSIVYQSYAMAHSSPILIVLDSTSVMMGFGGESYPRINKKIPHKVWDDSNLLQEVPVDVQLKVDSIVLEVLSLARLPRITSRHFAISASSLVPWSLARAFCDSVARVAGATSVALVSAPLCSALAAGRRTCVDVSISGSYGSGRGHPSASATATAEVIIHGSASPLQCERATASLSAAHRDQDSMIY